jgi:hypothetical protein
LVTGSKPAPPVLSSIGIAVLKYFSVTAAAASASSTAKAFKVSISLLLRLVLGLSLMVKLLSGGGDNEFAADGLLFSPL